jgi:hypothetical protein
MPWIPRQIESEDELHRQKTIYREEVDTINEPETKKEGLPRDQRNRMAKGKFSPVSTAEKPVTLKEIVNSR